MVNDCDVFRTAGKLLSVRETATADVVAAVGEVCEIHFENGERVLAEVISAGQGVVQLMVFHSTLGLMPGLQVIATGRGVSVPVGRELLGRTINALGQPIDNGGPAHVRRWRGATDRAPHSLSRSRVTQPITTGLRVIDGLLTIGCGQRMGLFAGTGVGKSTLLGEIARNVSTDLNIIALVGERGREVLPFIEDSLGDMGRQRSIVVVATADESSLMKTQAVKTAITIAEDFRSQGANVMFFLDSITRFAQAQREIGLSRGETPGVRGYPPSVQASLGSLLERLGNDQHGSITSLITVLVDGNDIDEPISDATRAILDGHLILDRALAAKGHYPAIDVLKSLSRVFDDVTSKEHQQTARAVREVLATHAEVADLIQVGLYQPGSSPTIDRCLKHLPDVQQFCRQARHTSTPFQETLQRLQQVAPITA